MKKFAVLTLMVGTVAMVLGAVTSASAQESVCGGTKVDFEDLPATIMGVVITVVDDNTVHFDIPEGSTVVVCVKAGSDEQGNGPEETILTADADLDHSSGKDISHVAVISVTTTTSSSPPPPPPSTSTPPPPPPSTSTPPPPPPSTTTSSAPPLPSGTTEAPPPPGAPGPNNPGPGNLVEGPPTTAFTGAEDIIPLAAIAFGLLLVGLYLLRRGTIASEREDS